MRRKSISVLLVSVLALFSMSTTIVLKIDSDKKNEQIKSLRNHLESLQEDSSLSGGAETTPEQTEVDFEDGYDFMFPVATEDYTVLTSPQGRRISPILHIEMDHRGLDIAGVWKSRIQPIKLGTVLEHWPPPGTEGPNGIIYKGHPVYGGYIVIKHDNGTLSKYAHLSETYVHQGDIVEVGDVIGRMGDTGIADGIHLHFELEISGKTVNPLLYIPYPTNK